VASLEHRTDVVDTREAGGMGRRGRVPVSLHHSWWLQLDTFSPTPSRGTGGAAGAKRILRHDHACREAPLAGCTRLGIQPLKIVQSSCCDHREAIPVASMLTLPPAGAGKLLLACLFPTIPPEMTLPEVIDTPRIHRVAPLTGDHTPSSPHASDHTIADVRVIGCA
jgi:hypothetical protein